MDFEKWDYRFLELAKNVSMWSKDPSTKVGSVITNGKRIVTVGYNGLPEDLPDDPELIEDRENKYLTFLHAEMNAILHANECLLGCTIYCYPFQPCSPCASAIIKKKIKRVVYPITPVDKLERWGKTFNLALRNFKKVGIECVERDYV